MYTLDGTKYENPKTIQKYEKKLAKLQRQLSHKEKKNNKKKKTFNFCFIPEKIV